MEVSRKDGGVAPDAPISRHLLLERGRRKDLTLNEPYFARPELEERLEE